jgi:hypothetical protein
LSRGRMRTPASSLNARWHEGQVVQGHWKTHRAWNLCLYVRRVVNPRAVLLRACMQHLKNNPFLSPAGQLHIRPAHVAGLAHEGPRVRRGEVQLRLCGHGLASAAAAFSIEARGSRRAGRGAGSDQQVQVLRQRVLRNSLANREPPTAPHPNPLHLQVASSPDAMQLHG